MTDKLETVRETLKTAENMLFGYYATDGSKSSINAKLEAADLLARAGDILHGEARRLTAEAVRSVSNRPDPNARYA